MVWINNKWKRQKEADIPWFPQKTNKALDIGLALLHVGTGCPLKGVLKPLARKWAQWASVLQRISLRERVWERERERKKDMGTQVLMEQGCFIQHSVGIYTALQSSFFLAKIKIKNPDLQIIKET